MRTLLALAGAIRTPWRWRARAGTHPPPHFHARYGEHVAEIAIDAPVLIDGWLPPRALRLVLEWAREHQAELQANWNRARAHEQLVGIDPLP